MKKKNLLLFFMMSVCFLLSLDRLADFYDAHFPVASEGDCITLNTSNEVVNAKIQKNFNKESESIIVVFAGRHLFFPYKLSYEQLRKMHAKKVTCNETFS